MAQATGIEWTDASTNPVRYKDADGNDVWACVKTSPGCAHCYSETLAARFERGGPFTKAQTATLTPYFSEKEARQVLNSKKLAGKRVFVGDMTDVFGEWVPDVILDQLFATLALRWDVTFQVLTKRAERMRNYFADDPQTRWLMHNVSYPHLDNRAVERGVDYTLSHVWLGVSVEDQQRADERIPHLLATPAAVRFLSCEPLLGPVDLSKWLRAYRTRGANGQPGGPWMQSSSFPTVPLNWIIVGGESGQGARPMHTDWARSLRDQCQVSGTAFFFKQWGESAQQCQLPRSSPKYHEAGTAVVTLGKKNSGRQLDGREWGEFPKVT